MQSKKKSFLESLTNLVVGFLISLLATFLIFPIFNIDSTPSKNLGITLFYSVISIIRSYLLRRYFNKKELKVNK